jgi:hypothetical protein
MAGSYSLLIGGSSADDDIMQALASLEVEEAADSPGAVSFDLNVARGEDGELPFVSDSRIGPFATIAVVATPDGGNPQCIFDGCILQHRLQLDPGTTNARLSVWGQDASWLMNVKETVQEWVDVTDNDVAGSIFGNYGVTPADANSDEDSPAHSEDRHSLMQRDTDIRFLQELARRSGKLCRVYCEDEPGKRIGFFAAPSLDGDPVATFVLTDPEAANVESLSFHWDVTRPTEVDAREALFDDSDEDGTDAEVDDAGLKLLADRGLAEFAGQSTTSLLTTVADSADELHLRALASVRSSHWFVRCEGQTTVSSLNAVLRVGDVVAVSGAGKLNSGKYLVWNVHHAIDGETHRMQFSLVRNAVGPAPTSSILGLLGGLL